mgnify:FL=1
MKIIETCEFDSIINDIKNHPEFLKLKDEFHHGISRYEHSLRVSKMVYKMTKTLNLNYEGATRAALLHDFFFNADVKEYNAQKTLQIHPLYACLNASLYFKLDKMQENMIKSHMFPVFLEMPKYKESLVLTIADKIVATHEMYRYKLAATLGIYMLFLFNVIMVQKWS